MSDEAARQQALDQLGIVFTLPEERFDRITRLAGEWFGVEYSAITLIDHDRQWFKSRAGISRPGAVREGGFCDYAIQQPGILAILDAREDSRFHNHPDVTGGPQIRFYAGCPLLARNVERVGTLCIFSTKPRALTDHEQGLLYDLALWAQTELAVAQDPDRAAQMQRDLLPPQIICLPGFEIAGACVPSRAVGGDIYNWYLTPDGAAFTLVDPAGTGLTAAITAAKVHAQLIEEPRHDDISAMAKVIADLLRADLNESSSCTTLFHARLDSQTGRVRYLDAGHGLSLVIHRDGTTDWLKSESLPLGIGAKSSWTEQTVTLAPDDTLVAISDGAVDLYDDRLTGLDELEKIVYHSQNAQDVVDQLITRIDGTSSDDVAILVIRRAL